MSAKGSPINIYSESTDDLCGDEDLTYEALYRYQGSRIKFNCDSVTYQGIIDSILPDVKLVKLRNCKIVNEDKYLGTLRFRFNNIQNFSVVESAEKSRTSKNEYLLNILKNDGKLQNHSISKLLYEDRLSEESDDEDNELEGEDEFILDLPSHLEERLPKDSIIIGALGEDFDSAINKLSKEHEIGVSFHSPVISRFDKLTWICISTSACTFLFDIQELKEDAFQNGLKTIFEEKDIKKVIHDCRFPSDCLAKQYSTQLTNVFDTQVADFVVNKQYHNDKYEFKSVSSLDCCIRNHLKVPPEFLYDQVELPSSEDLKSLLSKRPISKSLRYDLIKKSLYLLLLKEKLAKDLLSPLQKAVNVYLNVLSKASKEEYELLRNDLSPSDAIPPSILMYGIQIARFINFDKNKSLLFQCRFIDPKTDRVIKQSKVASKILPISESSTKDKIPTTKDKDNSESSNKTSLSNEKSLQKKFLKDEFEVITVKPSFRHLDEVYHKLVNRVTFDQAESSINVKPMDNYISKFSFRKPLDSELSENSSDESSSNQSSSCSDSEEIWARLREEHDVSYDFIDNKSILFVPG